MRKMIVLGALLLVAPGLSGCVVAAVGGAVVGGAVDVASTAVHVTGDVVSGVADVATGQTGDSDKDKDKKKSDDDSK
jgi:hypothetical protein